MLPTSLYIHIPWCIRKCPYCDFNSHQSPSELPEQLYIQALIDDLETDLQSFPARPLQSIFIGGGTPSLLSAKAYDLLLHSIQRQLSFMPDIEITLEANPGTVEQKRFNDYRSLGINRLSLGIQSFNSKHLKKLGRIHNDEEAHQAILCARRAGFDNMNLDLMYALPNQTADEALADLTQALSYQPEHISWYQLTLEPNTVFYKIQPPLPCDDDIAQIEERGYNELINHNYHRYEISAFCRSHRPSKHNLNYWLFGDYYGIGAGAHGKITLDSGEVLRTTKHRLPKEYLNLTKPFLIKSEAIQSEALVFEFMLNTTRLEQPIYKTLFTERTGLNFDAIESKLQQAVLRELLDLHEDYWQITPLGRRFTNDLQALFLER